MSNLEIKELEPGNPLRGTPGKNKRESDCLSMLNCFPSVSHLVYRQMMAERELSHTFWMSYDVIPVMRRAMLRRDLVPVDTADDKSLYGAGRGESTWYCEVVKNYILLGQFSAMRITVLPSILILQSRQGRKCRVGKQSFQVKAEL